VVSSGDETRIVLNGIGTIEVPPLFAGRTREASQRNLIFGIRPEHLTDRATLVASDNEADGSLMYATVDVVENLGNELLVYLTAGEEKKMLQARLHPRSQVSTGTSVSLQVDTDSIHLFDADTEQAIF